MEEHQDSSGPGPMTVVEAGKLGGRKTRQRYGTDHYRAIGKRGGDVTAQKGSDHFREIGSKGGKKLLKDKGVEYYQRIGQLGGEAVSKRGREFYSVIGKKGAAAKRIKAYERAHTAD